MAKACEVETCVPRNVTTPPCPPPHPTPAAAVAIAVGMGTLPILQKRKPNLYETSVLGHAAGKWQNQDPCQVVLIERPAF